MASFMCRNRHFRVLWSSKAGKQTTLESTDRFHKMSRRSLHEQFLQSLVCNVEASDMLLLVRLCYLRAICSNIL